MAKRTPLYEWHVAHGARIVDFAGWDMPVQYGSIVDEHQAVRTSAGLFDISHMGRLVFEEPGALDLIQRLFTNDAAAMKPGQVRYGLICNGQGGILDDVLVYRLEPAWLMVVNASNREKILAWIERNRGGSQARVTDITFGAPMIAVQGPRAVGIVSAMFRSGPWALPQGMPVEQMKYYTAQAASVDKLAARGATIVSRTGYTGEDGFEVILPLARLFAFIKDVSETAQQQGVELKPCGLGARDTLRLEAAMPLYGHELSEETDPLQAGLAWAVKMEKGDFIGRSALSRRRDDPKLRQRIGLELEGKRIAREAAAIHRDGAEVGRVSSGTLSPTLSKVIAMGYVDRACTAPGTVCEVDVRGKPAAARVVPLPFYRRPKN